MFGGKKPNKGYIYTNAKFDKVKVQVEELFLSVYHVNKLLIDGYISKSFAKVI
jgi:hypothetical protein